MEIVKQGYENILSIVETQLGPSCTSQLLRDFTINNQNGCISLAISKSLGIGLVVGGAILKLPQIIKIIKENSVDGISIPSYIMETISFTLAVVYNFRKGMAFTTYGEQPFITIQNLIILALLFSYRGKSIFMLMFMGVYVYLVRSLLNPNVIQDDILPKLYTMVTLLGIFSRVPQIISNFQLKSTGQLAAFTVLLTAVGAIARAFTTWKEVDDVNVLTGAFIAMGLNVILAGQMLIYGGGKKVSVQKKKQ